MSNHTPGPWKLIEGPQEFSPDAAWIIGSDSSETICDVLSSDCVAAPSDEEEIHANALLIAAAPDLLRAAKYALEVFAYNSPEKRESFFADCAVAQLAAVLALECAIDKSARGDRR